MRELTHRAGLCGSCSRARVTGNRRGSRFWLCTRAAQDPRYPRYPGLPVLRCAGYDPGVGPEGHDDDPAGAPGAADHEEEL